LSQPAVTQHIKALESRYGIEIFRRNGRNLTLTYEGKSLVDSAKKLIALERNIQKEIKKQKGQPKKLDIGITLTAGGYFIPEIMEVFKDKYPNLRFNFHTDIAENILERMRLNELDFAIIDGTSQTDEFNIELLFRDELIIIGPKDHRLADKKNVSIEELKKEKFILRHEKANTRLAFENYLSNHFDNINNFDVILEIDNTAMIKQLIIAGHGLSVMSKAICEINMQVGTLKQIDLRDFHLERGIYLVYPKELENSEIIDSILALKE
jgi:DNA-binding transcriptional LysR family regulator